MSGDRPALETDKIEITREMIEAGAEAILRDASLDVGPTKAEIIAEAVISRALAVSRNKNDVVAS
jgi:hypothetical protein